MTIPATAVTAEQMTRRSPEVVADVSRTAWKKSGTLNMMALERKAAMWLEKRRFLCGDCLTRCIGMMGWIACVST